jgi:hypothetical protein
MAILLRHNDVFTQTAGQLPWRAEKKKIPASVWPAHQTLVACAADDRGVNGDLISRPEVPDGATHFLHNSSAFMADRKRILDNLIADSSLGIIMHIRSAYTYSPNSEQDIGVFHKMRIRDFADFNSSSPC